jgi:para-nitrobenzyl esterase
MPAGNGVSPCGAFHTADVPYFLNYFYQDPTRPWEDVDYALGEAMSNYLVNFAKTGNPNGAGLPTWPAFSDDSVDLMELGDTVQLYAGMTKEQVDFWRSYFDSSFGWSGL